MERKQVTILGMKQDQWTHESCTAEFGVGNDWATLYHIYSSKPGNGHATALLIEAKKHYESQGKRFGGSVALSDRMASIYRRLGIMEYGDVLGTGLLPVRQIPKLNGNVSPIERAPLDEKAIATRILDTIGVVCFDEPLTIDIAIQCLSQKWAEREQWEEKATARVKELMNRITELERKYYA